MRVNAQEEKRKHGITCHTSRLLETGVPQRDFRVWLHPKRRLACPLRRPPMKPNGPRRRRRIDVPRRGTPSTQRSVCQLCKALLRIVISSEARNLCHSRSHGQCLKIPNGKPAIHIPSGIASYIWQRSCHHNPEPTTLNPHPPFENAPCKTLLTQPHQTDTITHA